MLHSVHSSLAREPNCKLSGIFVQIRDSDVLVLVIRNKHYYSVLHLLLCVMSLFLKTLAGYPLKPFGNDIHY